MEQPYLILGPLKVYFYGIFLSLAIFSVYIYSKYNSSKYKIESLEIDRLFPWLFIGGIAGSRIYHLLGSYRSYTSPLEYFYLWNGGLGIYGAVLGFLFVLFLFYTKDVKKLLNLLNLISPSVLLGIAVGRIGNYFNIEAFGPPANLPWKIFVPLNLRPLEYINNSYFHPTFAYESLLCFLFFIFFLILRKRINKLNNMGFAYFCISYGIIRLITEQYRFDTLTIGAIKIASVISIILIIIGVYLIIKTVEAPRRGVSTNNKQV